MTMQTPVASLVRRRLPIASLLERVFVPGLSSITIGF
jgi:hypothetical protein